jgi:chloramphenicol 3-O phosphotransferase
MPPGTIIMLNGTTSSGKSTILVELQRLLEGPWLECGIDKFIFMLPERYLDFPVWNEVLGHASHAGPLGHTLFSGMHQAIAAMAHTGNLILADHALVEPTWVQECAGLFEHIPAYLIGVRCDLQPLEERERARGDRTPGQARKQFERVHAHGMYDFEVDTTYTPSATCARQIMQFIATKEPPNAFRALRERSNV